MKKLIPSRGPEIDREKCTRNMGTGMYDMILAASARAREIRRKHKSSDKYEHTHTVVTALLEIQHGEIDGQEYFLKVK
jgi:DNA-directed RNA polymerase subunit K/omega